MEFVSIALLLYHYFTPYIIFPAKKQTAEAVRMCSLPEKSVKPPNHLRRSED